MSPKTTKQNEEIRQSSIDKILHAAFILIARNGYESTSIALIAKEAGVSKGLLYNYFTSKEELLTTLVNNAMNEGDKILFDIDLNNPKEAMKSIINGFFDDLTARPDHWKLMTEMTFKIEKFEFVHEILTNKINEYVAFLEELLKGIGIENPHEEARLMGSLFDGIGVHYLVMREDYPIDSMKAYLIKKYCS
jgi:AcrR family transcriptional regulator